MTNSTTTIGALLGQLNAIGESYFIPKDVKDWITTPDNGPVAAIKPWKTHKAEWWVFPAPPSEIEYYREETGLEITHLFISRRFDRRSIDDKLFSYHVGQYNAGKVQWRWIDPDKDYGDSKYALSNWKEGKLIANWTDRSERSRLWWFS